MSHFELVAWSCEWCGAWTVRCSFTVVGLRKRKGRLRKPYQVSVVAPLAPFPCLRCAASASCQHEALGPVYRSEWKLDLTHSTDRPSPVKLQLPLTLADVAAHLHGVTSTHLWQRPTFNFKRLQSLVLPSAKQQHLASEGRLHPASHRLARYAQAHYAQPVLCQGTVTAVSDKYTSSRSACASLRTEKCARLQWPNRSTPRGVSMCSPRLGHMMGKPRTTSSGFIQKHSHTPEPNSGGCVDIPDCTCTSTAALALVARCDPL